MQTTSVLANGDEIRAYLKDQVNLILRRPGMYGDEVALRLVVDHLLFAQGRPDAWIGQQRHWEERGAWTSRGIAGAFSDLLPRNCRSDSVASVYAEFAHRRGWLHPDRVLTTDEYDVLRGTARRWASRDRVWADVVTEFGTPSVLFGGTNPLYGKALGYVSADPGEPPVVFHLWNGSAPGTASSWPPDHTEPLLLAVRCDDAPFRESFTFTPTGRRLRPGTTEPVL
ncbi:hypothetical protein B4N89_45390 [Embleya scabrispora]|uniref:Uncharacterized protein n=1 Tax=Embleya scabrispora TaxID=159449 RepID=A0A1T3NIT7_9ACTN|nr:hypothetical protein [Embleya scabrispora]OPC76723.1 hypothetical protein B4N89_45390 [Embleya scabrispora]